MACQRKEDIRDSVANILPSSHSLAYLPCHAVNAVEVHAQGLWHREVLLLGARLARELALVVPFPCTGTQPWNTVEIKE